MLKITYLISGWNTWVMLFLTLLIEKEKFFSYPNVKLSILTLLRSKNVDYEKLARVDIKHELDGYLLRHKKPQLGEQVSIYWLINFSILCRLGQGSTFQFRAFNWYGQFICG